MKISKERLDKLKGRARSAGRAVVAGGKTTIYEAATGVGASYAGGMAESHITMVGDRPYLKGVALIVAGHLLKKNRRTAFAGAALVGAGGYALGEYLRNRNGAPAQPASTPAETRGFDAGEVTSYSFPAGSSAPADTGFVVRSAAHAA